MQQDRSSQFSLVLRMLGFVKYIRTTALITAFVIVGRTAFELLCVYFLSPTVTSVASQISRQSAGSPEGFWAWVSGDSASIGHLRLLLVWMAMSQLGLGVFTYLRHVWDSKLSMRAVYFLREHLYDRLQNIGFAFYDRMTSGQLINRALSDLQSVRAFINVSVINILDITVAIGGYLALLAWKSPWLALAALLPMPISCLIIMRFSRQAQPRYDAQQENADHLMVKLTETIYGVQVIKAFGSQERESAAYRMINTELLKRMANMIQLQAKLNPRLKTVAILSHVALFVLTSWLIQGNRMEVGDLMILGAAMGTILAKLEQVNLVADVFQRAVVSARRLFEVLDTPAEQPLDGIQGVPEVALGPLRFEHVTFGYTEAKPVLKDVTIEIPEGRMTALVGATGAGKTTLASLIARFYQPQQGRILIGAHDITDCHLGALRRTVGYVFQETFLFSATVRANILYGRSDVSEEMLTKAVRAADAEEFINGLPYGYETRLGEGGVMLSGGQRQRLALARALVYNPQILILDDATASLDAATEASVHDRLAPLLVGRTVVMIAHRVSTLHRADHIVVLDQGCVVQSGTHQSLLRQPGPYYDIVRLQLREDEARQRHDEHLAEQQTVAEAPPPPPAAWASGPSDEVAI